MADKRILIVEDDDNLVDIYQMAFSKVAGISLDITQSVEEADTSLHQNKPDLIILDLLLPGDVGLTLLEKLKQEGLSGSIPVLVATNIDDFKLINRALQLGARDYFVKSDLEINDLVEHCKSLLQLDGAAPPKPLSEVPPTTENPPQ